MPNSKTTNLKELPATSTPNNIVLSGRKPIHHDDSISPIAAVDNAKSKTSPKRYYAKALDKLKTESDESENSCNSSDDDELVTDDFATSGSTFNASNTNVACRGYNNLQIRDRKSLSRAKYIPKDASTMSENKGYIFLISIILSVVAAVVGVLNTNLLENKTNVPKTISIEELQAYYPMQLKDTWTALLSGIDEVKIFNKPSVFLLLYEHESEETINHMLANISRYAASVLNGNCDTRPIMVRSSDLNKAEVRADYGRVINKYKPQLEKVGIMIVKNVDEVPGEVAQAFHSMCDEYTPLVPRTVFFFTMRVENLAHSYKTDLELVERTLRNNWVVLEDDIFYPLFTRISSMVLRVLPEKL